MYKYFRRIWKAIFEPLMKQKWFGWTLAFIMSIMIWGSYFTNKHIIRNKKTLIKMRGKPAIFILWHGRSMMFAPMVCRLGLNGYVVASRSRDGRMMGRLLRMFGFRALYGTHRVGGTSVLRRGVNILRNNGLIALSPDGPTGPSLRIKDGAVYFAKMTGAPIIPVCFTTSRAWFQDRWDKYLIAKPFGRVSYDIGAPIYVSKDDDIEVVRKNLEDLMIKQQNDLDKLYGYEPAYADLTHSQYKEDKKKRKK